ncbi:YopX family protein [Streptococcus parauberis]|uniref:YopX family protein n=1 Tax=Streptococcus parauberis TaxID=1348 RepID=UPI0037874128
MIKFRAWDKANKKICDVKAWSELNGGEVTIKRDGENASYVVSLDDIILMQSTGLFDKNGVEIFEGDVVNFMVPNKMISGTYQVRQANSGEWRLDNRVQGRPLYISGSHNCEVIGNIYELESVEE